MTNALDALLGAKPAAEITESITMKRLGTEFIVKGLTGEDIDAIREQATYPVTKGKRTEKKVNEEEVSRLIVVKGTVEPNFADAQLLKHFGATDAAECVGKALLAGEIAILQTAILSASGFDADEDLVEEAKN